MISEFLRSAISIATVGIGLTGFCALGVQAADPLPLDVEHQALWSTPGDGTLIMLARNTAGFGPDNAMPVRVRVCVTNITGTNNSVNLYIWTTADQQPGAPLAAQPQTRHPELGDCVEIDRPAALIVQDSTVSGTSSGYYRLLEETALPKGLTVTNTRTTTGGAQKNHGRAIKIGAPVPAAANCSPLKSPTADFWAYCQLFLAVGHQGVRICIGTNYIKSHDGKTQYAASLLDLIVDKSKLSIDKPSSYDYNWNPVTPDGCRDLIGAIEAYFMVGPNSPGGYWDPSKVRSITVMTQTIDWTDEPE
ncbi:MAG: hypothetical protein ACHQRJ_04065 [Alphaproteobacteria bacterium]